MWFRRVIILSDSCLIILTVGRFAALRSWHTRLLSKCPDRLEAHSAFYWKATGNALGAAKQAGCEVNNSDLMPWLWMGGVLPLFLVYAFMACDCVPVYALFYIGSQLKAPFRYRQSLQTFSRQLIVESVVTLLLPVRTVMAWKGTAVTVRCSVLIWGPYSVSQMPILSCVRSLQINRVGSLYVWGSTGL